MHDEDASASHLSATLLHRAPEPVEASPNTVSSYRDTFRLLLKYAAGQLDGRRRGCRWSTSTHLIGLFLADIESTRGNSARSRNTRLSAIRSFFKYVAVNEPQLLHHCQRVRHACEAPREARDRLSDARRDRGLIQAPDLSTWHGRRDRALLALALQTGLRVSS